ncbi:22279_t:CDS:2 [Gigaspora margarita]|uniref:22279_t:CDS:1 n=1 Tax=Gigaspora margarita TaxID=4874 RepID=A0ABM8W750_GIGMA|nr:22279_t:CDS:2 [Gigaspora margarita]
MKLAIAKRKVLRREKSKGAPILSSTTFNQSPVKINNLTIPVNFLNNVLKIGIAGDSQIGKTALMHKFVEGSFNNDYIQTLGIDFVEKTITLKGNEFIFSIWDFGMSQRDIPLVCNDAIAVLFIFDLSRKYTLHSVKEWYKQVNSYNNTAIPFLIGTKYDLFKNFNKEDQEVITKQARHYARAMNASLIFCSASQSINVEKIFKFVLSKTFNLNCKISEIKEVRYPILEYRF